MNIGIIGTGGVGGYFGGKLAKLSELDGRGGPRVYFVARNEHLAEIKANGLILKTVDEGEIVCRPALATDDMNDLPGLDVCLICVKGYDLGGVLESVKDKIRENTHVIPLLNGVDIYERVRKVIATGAVYPSCVYVGTHIERPGKVVQHGGSRTIMLGADPRNPAAYPGRVLDLFDDAGIRHLWCDDPYREIWGKYVFIAAFGMVTAVEDKTIGQVLEAKKLREMAAAVMAEIAEVAKMHGVDLPARIIEDSLDKGESFPYETRTSFQRDFSREGGPDERGLFGDTIIRLGEAYGVATPVTRRVSEKLNGIKRHGQ